MIRLTLQLLQQLLGLFITGRVQHCFEQVCGDVAIAQDLAASVESLHIGDSLLQSCVGLLQKQQFGE